MRTGWNLAAGVGSAAWTAVITICTVPLYLYYLGVEAFGLIGFYTALQGLFAVFDLGLSQSISREVARATSDVGRAQARDLLHTLAFGYWTGAIVVGTGITLASPWIADQLTSASIDADVLPMIVVLMGVTIACRFPIPLYVGVLIGSRQLTLASGIEVTMVTVANLGAVAILAALTPTVQAFFAWQALIAVINLLAVKAVAWRVIQEPGAPPPRFDIVGVQRIWRFSAGVAVTTIIGALFVHSDRIVLSKIVTLADLGLYTLASIAARSLYILAAPAFSVVYPQLSSLHAAGYFSHIEHLYRFGTRLLMAILFPLAIFLAIFSEVILTYWTGDPNLAESLFALVAFLLIGTALNCAMHLPYALQLAYGRSSISMTINISLLVISAPLFVWLSLRFGATGAAAAWAILNTIYLFLGTWLMHRTLLPGVGLRWIGVDVGTPLLASLIIVGGGGVALQMLGLPSTAAAALGFALAGLAFLSIFLLSPGMAEFARKMFTSGLPLQGATM